MKDFFDDYGIQLAVVLNAIAMILLIIGSIK